MDEALPATHFNYIVDFDDAETRFVIYSSSDVNAGEYYFLDIEKFALSRIAPRYQQLPTERLQAKHKIEYTTRDGLNVEGFLTRPKGYQESQRYPMIVLPHGGPASYSGSGFNPWVQLFANRGYAVIQMNFRGSFGYGFDFLSQGFQGWGQAMQDDIEDATQAMITRGIADPNKICIVGASYGGYAALMGAIKTPELYRCAISVAGVSDLRYLVRKSQRYINHEIVEKQIGKNAAFLKRYSPTEYAEKVDVPVLLIHGDKDRIVDVHHSRKMFKKLKSEKAAVEYVELKNGTHYLNNNENRVQTFEAIDEFLQRYL